jgi:teichoic acid transport system permease protein
MAKRTAAVPATVGPTELKPVDELGSLGDYLREVWQRRGYWISVPADDLRVQNRRTVLGPLWLLLNPAIEIFIYYLIFGLLLEVDRGLDNFVGFLAVGIVTFALTAGSLPLAAMLIVRNSGLIRSLQFPKALLPLAKAMSGAYTFLIALPVVILTVILTGEPIRWQWILVVPAFAIAVVFATGTILIVARLGRRFADLEPLVRHSVRLLLYLSGVLYEPARWSSRSEVLAVFNVNPFYEMNTIMRSALISDVSASPWMWCGATLWACTVFAGGAAFFHRGELSYGA